MSNSNTTRFGNPISPCSQQTPHTTFASDKKSTGNSSEQFFTKEQSRDSRPPDKRSVIPQNAALPKEGMTREQIKSLLDNVSRLLNSGDDLCVAAQSQQPYREVSFPMLSAPTELPISKSQVPGKQNSIQQPSTSSISMTTEKINILSKAIADSIANKLREKIIAMVLHALNSDQPRNTNVRKISKEKVVMLRYSADHFGTDFKRLNILLNEIIKDKKLTEAGLKKINLFINNLKTHDASISDIHKQLSEQLGNLLQAAPPNSDIAHQEIIDIFLKIFASYQTPYRFGEEKQVHIQSTRMYNPCYQFLKFLESFTNVYQKEIGITLNHVFDHMLELTNIIFGEFLPSLKQYFSCSIKEEVSDHDKNFYMDLIFDYATKFLEPRKPLKPNVIMPNRQVILTKLLADTEYLRQMAEKLGANTCLYKGDIKRIDAHIQTTINNLLASISPPQHYHQ